MKYSSFVLLWAFTTAPFVSWRWRLRERKAPKRRLNSLDTSFHFSARREHRFHGHAHHFQAPCEVKPNQTLGFPHILQLNEIIVNLFQQQNTNIAHESQSQRVVKSGTCLPFNSRVQAKWDADGSALPHVNLCAQAQLVFNGWHFQKSTPPTRPGFRSQTFISAEAQLRAVLGELCRSLFEKQKTTKQQQKKKTQHQTIQLLLDWWS